MLAFRSSISLTSPLREDLTSAGFTPFRLPLLSHVESATPSIPPALHGGGDALTAPAPDSIDEAEPPPGDGFIWESDEPVIGPGADLSRLQANALSLDHLCTHEPKNDHCPECLRSKAQNRQHRRLFRLHEQVTQFGDLVTADHVYSHSEALAGIDGALDQLVIFDVGTGMLGCYPAASKGQADTCRSLIHFQGQDKSYKKIYTDASKELIAAIKDLGINTLMHDTATPGMPQTNGMAESMVRRVVHGTRAILATAGLPHCYWSLASVCFAMLRNTALTLGDSPWFKYHGEHFKGQRLPFGCLVSFIPSPTSRRFIPSKYDQTSVPGVFLGYKLHAGCRWGNQYRVAMLEEFVDRNFHRSCRASEHNIFIQTVERVIHSESQYTFPLQELWRRDNLSPLGIMARLVPDARSHPLFSLQRDQDDHEQAPDADMLGQPEDAPPRVDVGGGVGPLLDMPDSGDDGEDPVPSVVKPDEWVESEHTWIRVHHNPRTLPFMLRDAEGVTADMVEPHRTTHVRYFDGTQSTDHTLDHMGPDGRRYLRKRPLGW